MPTPLNAVSVPLDTARALKEDDITCQISGGVFIDPYITNCCKKHIEKLALARSLREDKLCPFCRKEITSAVPDTELAKKIQEQFVKISKENEKIFEAQKKVLETASVYASVRGAPVLPSSPVSRTVHVSAEESERFLGGAFDSPAIRGFADLFLSAFDDISESAEPSVPLRPVSLHTQVLSSIRSDNLLRAEMLASQIPNSSFFKNKSFEKIAEAYLAKADRNIIYLDDATRIAMQVTKRSLQVNLLSTVAIKFAQNKKYAKAIHTTNKIKNFFIIALNYLIISLVASFHGFMFILRTLAWPFVKLKRRLSS